MSAENDTAYNDGFKAASIKRSDLTCPYPQGTQESDHWLEGWRDGKNQVLNGFFAVA